MADTCRSEAGVRLAVYKTPGLVLVADNGSYGDCRIAWRAHAGDTYAIALDSGAAQIDTALKMVPATGMSNDDFANAESIGPGYSGGFTLDGATAENGEPPHGGRPATKSVWLKWTATFSGLATIGTCEDEIRMAVYAGTQIQSLTPVGDNGASRDCVVNFFVQQGVQYDIALDSFGGQDVTGGWGLTANPFPPNDDFANAAVINPPFGGLFGTTVAATAEPGEPDHFPGVEAAYSVWYRWTAPGTERVTFDTCGELLGADTLLAVYSGASLSSLTPLGQNDDGPTCDPFANPFGSQVTINVMAGHQYYIAVDSYDMGRFDLQVSQSGPSTDIPPPPPPPRAATMTGRRAAALKKCKKRKGPARKRCRKHAAKLPI